MAETVTRQGLEQVQQNSTLWSIDSNRIYAAGISAGAATAGILGATYPDVFAAIGVHSGLEYQAAALGLLFLTFLCLTIGELGGGSMFHTFSGYFGLATAVVGFYTALASMKTPFNLPVGPRG